MCCKFQVFQLASVANCTYCKFLGMVGDLDDHKISSVQNFSSVKNFRYLGAVEAYNSYNGIETFCMLSRVASQLKIHLKTHILRPRLGRSCRHKFCGDVVMNRWPTVFHSVIRFREIINNLSCLHPIFVQDFWF